MAISRSTPSTNNADGSTASITMPTRSAGDLLVVVLTCGNTQSEPDTPTGWTKQVVSANGLTNIYTRIATNDANDNFQNVALNSLGNTYYGIAAMAYWSDTNDFDEDTLITDFVGTSGTQQYGIYTLDCSGMTAAEDQLVVIGLTNSGSKTANYTGHSATTTADSSTELQDWLMGADGPGQFRGGGVFEFYYETTALTSASYSAWGTLDASASWDGAGIVIETASSGPTYHDGAATLTGVGTVTAVGDASIEGAATLTGVGTLAATPQWAEGTATLTGLGYLWLGAGSIWFDDFHDNDWLVNPTWQLVGGAAGIYQQNQRLEVVIDDSNPDPTIAAPELVMSEPEVWVRYNINFQAVDSGVGDKFGGTRMVYDDTAELPWALGFQVIAGPEVAWYVAYKEDDGVLHEYSTGAVPDGTWFTVRVGWKKSSAPGADDGWLKVFRWAGTGPWVQILWVEDMDTDEMTADWVEFGNFARSAGGVGEAEWFLDYFSMGASYEDIRESAVVYQGAATLTGTGTVTATGQVEHLGQVTLTGVGAVTATGQVWHTGIATLTGVGTLTATPESGVEGAATLTGLGTCTANGQLDITGAATLAGVGTLTATGVLVPPAGTATLTGVGTLTGTGTTLHAGAVTVTGVGTLEAAGSLAPVDGAATLTGLGTLDATAGANVVDGASTLQGVGALTAAGGVVVPGAVNLAGVGLCAAAGVTLHSGAATLTGVGTLDASADTANEGTAVLTGQGTLQATADTIRHTGQATVTGVGLITGSPTVIHAGAATATGVGTLTGTGVLVPVAGAATLYGVGTLTATAESANDGQATLLGVGTLTATGQLVPPTGTATLTGIGLFAGSAEVAYNGQVSLAGVGTADATGEAVVGGISWLTGQGTVTSTSVLVVLGGCLATGTGTLNATGALWLAGDATLLGVGVLVATSETFYWQPGTNDYASAQADWTPNVAGYTPVKREGA